MDVKSRFKPASPTVYFMFTLKYMNPILLKERKMPYEKYKTW